jgi:hypothetical protein
LRIPGVFPGFCFGFEFVETHRRTNLMLLQLLLLFTGCDQAPLRGRQPKASGSAAGPLLVSRAQDQSGVPRIGLVNRVDMWRFSSFRIGGNLREWNCRYGACALIAEHQAGHFEQASSTALNSVLARRGRLLALLESARKDAGHSTTIILC